MREIMTITIKHEANTYYATSADCPGKVGIGATIDAALLDFVREMRLPMGQAVVE